MRQCAARSTRRPLALAVAVAAACPGAASANTDGRAAAAPAGVRDIAVRRGCTWSRPGADPWQSSPVRDRAALAAMGVPADYVDVAIARMAGPPDDYAAIGRRGVRLASGEPVEARYDMTFGRAVCRGVRADFGGEQAAPVWRVAPGVWIARPVVCGNLTRLHPIGTIPPAVLAPPARPDAPVEPRGAPPAAPAGPPAGFYPPAGFVPPAAAPGLPWPQGPAPWLPWVPQAFAPGVPAVPVAPVAPLAAGVPIGPLAPAHPVPAPPTAWLAALGLAMLAMARRRRRGAPIARAQAALDNSLMAQRRTTAPTTPEDRHP